MNRFHDMPRDEFVRHIRSLYLAQPKADWDKLAVGNIVMYRGRAWRITHIPPKRGFVMAMNVLSDQPEKLLRSQYATADLRLTTDKTLARLRTVHPDEIKKAMAAGITISPLVQYDYPEIFTPFPAEWDEKRREKAQDTWRRINEMRAFHDRSEGPGWQFNRVADLIAQAEEDIARWKTYRAEVKAGVKIKKPEAIPGIVSGVDTTISELKEQIEILGHLRKHLENTLR
jgi:hypothetical protein